LDKSQADNDVASLFEQPLDVISIGLDGFAEELTQQQVQVTHLDWRPPAQGQR